VETDEKMKELTSCSEFSVRKEMCMEKVDKQFLIHYDNLRSRETISANSKTMLRTSLRHEIGLSQDSGSELKP